MIEIKNISKSYKINKMEKILALKNVTLTLPNKGMVFITGQSGSGKSTLLNIIGLLDNFDTGEIILNQKNITKLKSKEIDYYRNTYIGFIFQEYNLLDNFNVFENIEIALNLQNKKKTKEEIIQVLNQVGLTNLESRKISELSGGQRQRVAIARALIKDANVILADEPTGNLDKENGEQIFQILKKIAQDKLVIVVSHDLESTNKYADRIIELKDGIIINDILKNNLETKDQNLNLIKSKLSLLNSLKISFRNLKTKKLKLIITTLLITLSFSVFSFFFLLTNFDINKTHAKTLINEGENRIEINKKIKGKNFTTASAVTTFTKDEITDVISKLKSDTIEVNKALENNFYLSIPQAENPKDETLLENYAYYDFIQEDTKFLEYSDENLSKLKIIGNLPTNNNEILINKIYADYILNNGLSIWGVDKNNNLIKEDYYPENYEQLINDQKKIVFGTSYLKISGIIDENLEKYQPLKQILSAKMEINKTKLYQEFQLKYNHKLSEVIVRKDFFTTLNLLPNDTIDKEFYKLVYKYGNKSYYPLSDTKILNKKIKIYNGIEEVELDNLKPNEMIIDNTLLEIIYKEEYVNKILEEISKAKSEYEQKVAERNKKIKEQDELLLKDPTIIIEIPKEIEQINIEKIIDDVTKKFIIEKQLIGKTISLEVNDLYLRIQKEKTKTYEDFKIIGYVDDISPYFSNQSPLKQYMRENNEVTSIYFYENNQQELEKIFKIFPEKGAKYVSKTSYSETIKQVKEVVEKVVIIAKYFTIFSLIFSIILFIYFTVSSVNSNKKSIGILRALGAKVKDIYKIFYLETFIVGILAISLSTILSFYSVKVANKLISSKLFIDIKPIIFRYDIILILFILLLILTMLSFVIPIFKISKTKPIDVIRK